MKLIYHSVNKFFAVLQKHPQKTDDVFECLISSTTIQKPKYIYFPW